MLQATFFLVLTQFWLYGSAQDCLRPANTSDSLPNFEDLSPNADQIAGGNGALVIVTSYQFQCCGNITAWLAYVWPNAGRHQNGAYSINFQVWRPSPTVGRDGAGEYSLVGENRFTSITFANNDPVSETPEPTNVISVRPRDVVGFYQLSNVGLNDGIQLNDISFSHDRLLWYQTSFVQGNLSTLVAGNGGALLSSTNAGVQLSVDISSSLCTPLPTPPPTTPPPTAPPPTTPPPTTPPPITPLPTTTAQSVTAPLSTGSLLTPSRVGPQTTSLPTTDQTTQDKTGVTSRNDHTFPPLVSPNVVNIGLVAGLVVVIVLLLIASAIIAAIIVMRYHKTESKKLNNQTRIDNPVLHGEGDGQNLRLSSVMKPMTSRNLPEIPSDGITNIGYRNHSFRESIEESQHYYSAVGALTDSDARKKVASDPVVLNSGGYDVCLAQDYIEPINQSGISEEQDSKEPVSWEDEDIYMVPGSDEVTLYAQLADRKANILTRSILRLGQILGSGQFGTVYEGVWQSTTKGDVEVAVKTLNEGSTQEDKIKFLQEAAIMGQFKHPNVVEMYGVITDKEPILLVLEMLKKGDLRAYLLKIRNEEVSLDDHTLLSYCRQVASGMAYLSSKAFVHRDLAARNILVSDEDICKIADFGMSRDLMDESYYVSHGGMIPVKWTAPEALHYKKYSTASDVWSYGALMYEIWSVGHKPFEKLANTEIIKKVDSGYRLPPPPGCPRAIYNIMIQCWHPVASKRPSFKDISSQMTSCPEAELLKWSDEDRQTHLDADKLGADLDFAQNLYLDLQTLYDEKNYS